MPLRCLLWLAVSTSEQADDDKMSLSQQEADARAIAEKEGLHIVDVLIVPGHSRRYVDIHRLAADAQRQGIDAFHRLLRHFEDRDFDVLVCRDSDRFARTQSLHAYIVESVIDIGARIYSLADGWVNDKNYRMFIAMAGYKAASNVDGLVALREQGMRKRAERGLPAHTPVWSHRLVRDSAGRAERLEVDETTQDAVRDAAALLLEGVAWNKIGRVMYERYGHVSPATNKPYHAIHSLFFSPYFWGNTAHNFTRNDHTVYGAWCFDASETPPEGAEVFYDTHPPALTGDLAKRVQQEMRRRFGLKGKSRPYAVSIFSGLLLCENCGYGLLLSRSGSKKTTYYHCASRYVNPLGCDKTKVASVERFKAQITPVLQKLHEGAPPEAVFATADTEHSRTRLERVERAIAEANGELLNLVRLQAKNSALEASYQTVINETNERLNQLTEEYNALKRLHAVNRIDERQRVAIEALRRLDRVEEFWEQSDIEVNRDLHTILGRWRFFCLNGEIMRLARAK